MTTIFISYSRKDTDYVQFLEPQIYNIYGHASLWYDVSIQGGDAWWNKIKAEIQNCQIFLFLVSDSSVESHYCRKELKEARYNRKIVLPGILPTYKKEYPEGLPKGLFKYMKKIQYVDLQGIDPKSSYSGDLSKLWGAINRSLGQFSISETNRLILFNQFEILRLLHKIGDIDDAEDHEIYKEIISSGYEWSYRDILEPISPAMQYGDCEEVYSILEMYRAIYGACQEQGCSDVDSLYLKFGGFDLNKEPEHYSYTRFLMEKRGYFKEIKPDNDIYFNSHRPMLPAYRKMLKEWRRKTPLTKEDVIRILNVAQTP